MKTMIITVGFLGLFFAYGCKSDTLGQKNQEKDESGLEREYLAKGMAVTARTFEIMSGQLMQAVKEGGVASAVEYCSLNAYAMVDSIARRQNVRIKRTSHKLRNQENRADSTEDQVIRDYLAQAETPAPRVQIEDDKIRYFAPILIMDNCLKCHGQLDSSIKPSDYEVIQELYPEDEAIGFKVGDLRGIWSLEFTRN